MACVPRWLLHLERFVSVPCMDASIVGSDLQSPGNRRNQKVVLLKGAAALAMTCRGDRSAKAPCLVAWQGGAYMVMPGSDSRCLPIAFNKE